MERLIERFEEIVDVKDSSGKRHCLMHIIVMSVCGILNKCIDYEDIYDYTKAKEKWFNKKLGLWNGIPSSATFRNVFRLINPEQFLKIFMNWINEIIKSKTGKQIIIDGKAIRGATERCIKLDINLTNRIYLFQLTSFIS